MFLCTSQNGLGICRRVVCSAQHVRYVSTSSSVKDYYQVLGVQRDATQRQIKVAYYQLSKKYHPDVAGHSAGSEAKFIEITEAYECLKDPERRRIYDNGMCGTGERHAKDPYNFRDFRQYSGRRSGNPFYNRQYTQQEYQRVWEQFNRMRSERESYDAQMRRETEKIWEEFAKQRAERWQRFHAKYPDGPPGSIKYEWRWTSSNPTVNRNITFFTRVTVIYMILFMVITILQVISQPFVSSKNWPKESKPEIQSEEPKENKPRPVFNYMNQPPGYNDDWSSVINNSYPENETFELGYNPTSQPSS
ncbi:hypothetical protein RB195_015748 [Necator americanus]